MTTGLSEQGPLARRFSRRRLLKLGAAAGAAAVAGSIYSTYDYLMIREIDITVGWAALSYIPQLDVLMQDSALAEKNRVFIEWNDYKRLDALYSATAAGSVDASMYLYFPAAAMARAEGSQAQIVYPTITSSHTLFVRADSEYQSFEDLRDRKVGIFEYPPVTPLIAGANARRRGVEMNGVTDLKLETRDLQSLPAKLLEGEFEAVEVVSPYRERMKAEREFFRSITTAASEWKELTGRVLKIMGISVKEDLSNALPDRARRLVSLWRDVVSKASSDSDILYRLTRQYTGLRSDDLIEEYLRNLKSDIQPLSWEEEDVQNLIDLTGYMLEARLISRIPPKLFTNRFA